MRFSKSPLLIAALVAAGAVQAQDAVVESLSFFKSSTIETNYVPFQAANLVLQDDFLNGNPLVSEPRVGGDPFNYSLPNALQLPTESNGKLSIFANASTVPAAPSAAGDPFYSYGVRLLTNANESVFGANNKLQGLGKDSTWSMAATFDPLMPSPGALYQIRLTDFGIGTAAGDGNDVLQLQLRSAAGGPLLQLVKQNFVAGTVAVLWSKDIDIPVQADQLRMGFAHLNAGTGVINAYYSFFDGATSLSGEAIAATASLFSDEMLTRFEVRAAVPVLAVPVPEPASVALWAVGLVGLLTAVRARRGRSST